MIQTEPRARDAPDTLADRARSPAPVRARRPQRSTWAAVIVLGLAALILRAVHLDRAWDLHIDEVVYVHIAESIAAGRGVQLYNAPFFVHPPLFFLIEAALITLHPLQGDVFDHIYRLRYLNVILGALSAVVLALIVTGQAGRLAGLAAGAICALDPFILRINSYILLETSATFWLLLGYWPLLVRPGAAGRVLPWWRVVLAGVAFGLATLTKEKVAVLTLGPLLACFALGWALPRLQAFAVAVLQVSIYALYPVGALLTGTWGQFEAQKLRGGARFVGVVQETGFNQAGGPSFLAAIMGNLVSYATTYALMALGGLAILVLLRRGGAGRRLLAVWSASAYGLLAYSILFGANEEQFYYFLVVPAVATTTIAAADVIRATRGRRARRLALGGAAAMIGVFALWSALVWARVHFTADNGYEQTVAYLREHVPPGSKVAVTTGVFELILAGYDSGTWGSPEAITENAAAYVVLSVKHVRAGYGVARPETLAWLDRYGSPVYTFMGPTNERLVVYRVPPQPRIGSLLGERPEQLYISKRGHTLAAIAAYFYGAGIHVVRLWEDNPELRQYQPTDVLPIATRVRIGLESEKEPPPPPTSGRTSDCLVAWQAPAGIVCLRPNRSGGGAGD